MIEGGTGKVLFEHTKELEDFVVSDISSDPRYLKKIEQLQIDAYVSTEPVVRSWEFNYTLAHNLTNGKTETHNRTLRFRAQSMRGEGNPFDLLPYRPYRDVNLIVVMAEIVERSENIFGDGLRRYITVILFNFKWLGIIIAGGLTFYFVTFSLALVKLQIVNPIVELSDHIVSPEDTEKINLYIAALKKREYDREFKRNIWIQNQEKKRKAKMKKELNRMIE